MSKVSDLAEKLGAVAITPRTKKLMGDMLVVVSSSGNGNGSTTTILNGASHLGIGLKDGITMPTAEFNQKRPAGIQCLHNPKFGRDGSLKL